MAVSFSSYLAVIDVTNGTWESTLELAYFKRAFHRHTNVDMGFASLKNGV